MAHANTSTTPPRRGAAFSQGHDAGVAGRPASANPHRAGTAASRRWEAGRLKGASTRALDQLTTDLIRLRHGGTPWAACAEQLGHSADALKRRARRLRDAEQWVLPDGEAANGAPVKGKLGRPRKEVRSVPVSPRVSPEVAEQLRHVAEQAGLLLGEVVTEALYRATTRANGVEVRSVPFGLERGEYECAAATRAATVSVNVPQPVYDDFVAATSAIDAAIMTRITDALHELLADLGYTIDA